MAIDHSKVLVVVEHEENNWLAKGPYDSSEYYKSESFLKENKDYKVSLFEGNKTGGKYCVAGEFMDWDGIEKLAKLVRKTTKVVKLKELNNKVLKDLQ